MSPHFLFFGKLFRLRGFVFCIAKVIGKKAAPCTFEKITLAPWPSRKANIKRSPLPAFEAGNNFFRRCGETKTACQIIGRAQRKNAQRNTAIDEFTADLSDRTVSASDKQQVSRFF